MARFDYCLSYMLSFEVQSRDWISLALYNSTFQATNMYYIFKCLGAMSTMIY